MLGTTSGMWSFPAFGCFTDIRASDGHDVPHVRRPQRFQNPCDDDIRGHGTQVFRAQKGCQTYSEV